MASTESQDDILLRAAESGSLDKAFRADVEMGALLDTYKDVETLLDSIRLPATVAARWDASIGRRRRVGRYWLERELGRGGVGTVYLAYDEELERPVALKIPHPELLTMAGANPWMLREAQLSAKLRHPAVVAVYDVGHHDDACYIVSEYVAGQTLEELLAAGPLDNRRAAELTSAIAAALAHAHRQGLVHRDLKPGNILVDRQGRPHVTDFGMAILDGEQRATYPQLGGTARFMSPEQLPGENPYCDGRSDIWSLGVLLYRMLTGRLPFDADARDEVFAQIRLKHPKPPRQIDPAIPADLERICLKCLAKDPRERYSSAGELSADLERWCDRAGRRMREIAARLAAVALLVVTLTALSVWWTSSSPSAENTLTPRRGAIQQLDVTSMRVAHFGGDAVNTIYYGDVGTLSQAARFDDNLRVRVELNRPAYCYLIAFNADGSQQLCHPANGATPPAMVGSLHFPPGASKYFGLTDGLGFQAVAVLAADSPLPAYDEWSALKESLPWQATSGEGVWQFAGGGTVTGQFSRVRGPVRTRAVPPAELASLCRALADLPGIDAVRLIAFPVQSRDATGQTVYGGGR